MKNKLYLSAGMPRAGSGWYYNLTHDLLVAAGSQDARDIRNRYHLGSILTEVNCNIGALTLRRMLLVLVPVVLGNKFIIKTHAGLTQFVSLLIHQGVIIPLYIYRDPRDALLSAYEYGERARQNNRDGAFSQLLTFDAAIMFMQEYVDISESWLACNRALHTRYEDMLLNYDDEVKRILNFLEIDRDISGIKQVIAEYRPDGALSDQRGRHLVKGKIGRFREKLTPAQQLLCQDVFKPYIEKMGYPL